ncbi:MAG TPA: RlmE family RNA methyltransferase [Alphaproteobacteria bacterium]|jgi:23S rRNA (uridine2552-2'-O)-methyltransferase|nr:RlmE family RNA methyltransferase [Alphaproteobacteria bacterium]
MTDKKPPKPPGKGGTNPRGLQKKVRVKTRAKRSISSARWLERQLNDPYVAAAKSEGYHSRAAYKLLEINAELDIFKPGMKVVDLGAAPGGWTQVVCDIVKPGENGGKVVAIDYLEMKPVSEAEFFLMDFTDDEAPDVLKNAIGGKAHVVMSDMAPPTMGHKQTDHIRIMALAELAYDFAKDILLPEGVFLAKVFQGGAERDFLNQLKKDFQKVKHIKPPASRSDSSEMYVVALGFRG